MKKSVKSILVLVCICATVSVLLSLTNYITAPIIRENEEKNTTAALLEVLPDGGSFEAVDISGYKLPETVSSVYRAESGGYVIKLDTAGYASGMVIMCGISSECKVVGTKLLSSGETPSIGGVAADAFSSSVLGKDISNIDGVDTVSGATKTTAAYRAAIKDALRAVIILGVPVAYETENTCDNVTAINGASGCEKAILCAFESIKIFEEGK